MRVGAYVLILKEFAMAKLFDGGADERGAEKSDSSPLGRDEFRGDAGATKMAGKQKRPGKAEAQ
jgi:hypothetical protein